MEERSETSAKAGYRRGRLAALAGIVLLSSLAASEGLAIPSPKQRVKGGGGSFGLGLSLGDPMGLSAKYFMHPNHALQWHVAWLPLHHGSGGVSMDYLWHPVTIASAPVLNLVPYFGGGVGFGLWGRKGGRDEHDQVRFGLMLRALVGLAIHWKPVPLDTVIEGGWTPYVLETNPARFGAGHGDISFKIRYYF